jgi:hypothetical protein
MVTFFGPSATIGNGPMDIALNLVCFKWIVFRVKCVAQQDPVQPCIKKSSEPVPYRKSNGICHGYWCDHFDLSFDPFAVTLMAGAQFVPLPTDPLQMQTGELRLD